MQSTSPSWLRILDLSQLIAATVVVAYPDQDMLFEFEALQPIARLRYDERKLTGRENELFQGQSHRS
ncbi:MAG: hypothetical protein ACKVII_26330, partial [Planctomycetales bacterium]